MQQFEAVQYELWFDVGVKRYTTAGVWTLDSPSCGLMQESKDIQLNFDHALNNLSCGLMQESKDIQQLNCTP